jgi:5-methylthioadenosine/S-adenosylhomocysteine deaminase
MNASGKPPAQPAPADLIISARHVIPVEPAGLLLEDHAVVVRNGRIIAVMPSKEARRAYVAGAHTELATHALIPGLINLHTHAAMALMRGLADDLPLMEWLTEHIWPAEAKHVSEQFVFEGTLLACAEMIRGGVTCFNDMYFFPEQAGRAVLAAGMRAALGIICIEFPTAYAADAQDYLHKGIAARDALRHEALLSFCMAPHAPYTVSDRSFEQIVTYADELQIPIHMHLHETQDEIRESLKAFGARPVQRMHRLGLLGPGLIAVHAVHLDASEIALLRETGSHVAHCPSSNLKLASGIAPVAAMLEAGVNVGLGTDGAASNNRLDLLEEMRLAALLAKGAGGRPTSVPAQRALAMATIDAARALGLEAEIGSITPGKQADLTAVDLAALELSPCYHPMSHLVYAAAREHVSHVWVGGEPLLHDGRLTTLDTAELAATAASWQQRIAPQA